MAVFVSTSLQQRRCEHGYATQLCKPGQMLAGLGHLHQQPLPNDESSCLITLNYVITHSNMCDEGLGRGGRRSSPCS